MDKLAPIILFVYNRPEHTKRTIESLMKNDLASKSELFIFSDCAKIDEEAQKVKAVREYIITIKGFQMVEVIESDRNLGLARSVISGVSNLFNKYQRLIVLEDDIITSPNFLTFMNNALKYYKNDNYIFSISGYLHPIHLPDKFNKDVFITYRSSSWGWATWKDRWQKVDWELKNIDTFWKNKSEQKMFNRGGNDLTAMLNNQLRSKIDSWAIRWAYAHFKNNSFCLYPRVSFCKNIGMDRTGTHSANTRKYDVQLACSDTDLLMEENPELDENISNAIRYVVKPSVFRTCINFVRILFSQI